MVIYFEEDKIGRGKPSVFILEHKSSLTLSLSPSIPSPCKLCKVNQKTTLALSWLVYYEFA